MDNTLFFVNLLHTNIDKVRHCKNLKKKFPFIKILKSIHWREISKIKKTLKQFKVKSLTKKRYDTRNYKNLKIKYWCRSEIAIWATYLKTFNICLKTNKKYKYFVIFEDDVMLHKNFLKYLNKYYIENKLIDKEGGIRLGRNLVGSIFTREQIKKIFYFVQKYGIFKAIDDQLIEHNILKKFTVKLVEYNRNIKSEQKSSRFYKIIN